MSGAMKYAIVDTGTSLMYMIPNDWSMMKQVLLDSVPELQCDTQYCYSDTRYCNQLPNLPDLKINLGQMSLRIPA